MPPKIKIRSADATVPTTPLKHLMLHGMTKPPAFAAAASRRLMVATQPASGTANHARHHVSRKTQA